MIPTTFDVQSVRKYLADNRGDRSDLQPHQTDCFNYTKYISEVAPEIKERVCPRGVLLPMKTGTGKSRAACAAIDGLGKKPGWRIVLFMKKSIIKNFLGEWISYWRTSKRKPNFHADIDLDKGEVEGDIIAIPSNASRSTKKNLESLSWEKTIWICDEWHHTVSSIINGTSTGNLFMSHALAVKEVFFIFMTGTPVYKQWQFLLPTMTLLRPDSVPGNPETFAHAFVDEDSKELRNAGALTRRCWGLVIDVEKYEKERPETPPLDKLQLIRIPFSDFQRVKYNAARMTEKKEAMANKARREAMGMDLEGSGSFRIRSKMRSINVYDSPEQSPEDVLGDLPKYSPKIEWLKNQMKEWKNKRVAVWSQFKNKYGCALAAAMLKSEGYNVYDTTDGRDRQTVVNEFNSISPKPGVIVFSPALAEGVTFKDVEHLVILGLGKANMNAIDQVVARVRRFRAHSGLPKGSKVTPYLLLGVMPKEFSGEMTTDEYVWKSSTEIFKRSIEFDKAIRRASINRFQCNTSIRKPLMLHNAAADIRDQYNPCLETEVKDRKAEKISVLSIDHSGNTYYVTSSGAVLKRNIHDPSRYEQIGSHTKLWSDIMKKTKELADQQTQVDNSDD